MKKDILANYVGQFCSAFMNVAFIPVYITQMGVEAFGLIGVLATLQACFGLLDMGMTPVLGRETARFLSGAHSPFSIRSLLRSAEVIILFLALLIAVLIYVASGWIASHWLNSSDIEQSTVALLLTMMGAIVGLRLVETLYRSALIGLHRQVNLNAGIVFVSTLRGLGSAGVLVFVAPTMYAYLIWQLACSLLAVGAFGLMTYQALPACSERVTFTTSAFKGVRRFAAGMTAISALAVLITQSDKIILSKLLSLADFGTYALAGMVAGIPQMLASPILQALQPRLTRQLAASDETEFTTSFHTGAQIVSAMVGSASIILIVFSSDILAIWLQNDAVSQSTATLVSVLAIGNLLNGLVLMPYISQLAHGWTGLSVRWNLIAVAVQIPLLIWIVPRYGALGAAWIWVALNAAFFLVVTIVMFRRILINQRRSWLVTDLARPLITALFTAFLAKWIAPGGGGLWVKLAFLLIGSGAVLAAASVASPAILSAFRQYIPGNGLFRNPVV